MAIDVHQKLKIEGADFEIAEHPHAKGMPYGQEGRKAVVYQLVDNRGIPHALKVFKPRFRAPHMTLVAEKLAPYAGWHGLKVCQRTVLTATRYASLISNLPELTYAELMPWIDGQTWQEVLLGRHSLPPEESLAIARSLASVLVRMEEQGLAHCDLSSPNLILTPNKQVELVDLEEMYLPGFQRPGAIPSGSPGYGHRTAAGGLWGSTADRFSGGLLLAEMLGWCDERIVQAAWGESYFSPEELQQDCSRYQQLVNVLAQRCGKRIAELFARAWNSDSLDDCPMLAEWLVAIPKQMAGYPLPEDTPEEKAEIPSQVRELIELARKLEGQGNFSGARLIYEQGLKQILEGSKAALDIKLAIDRLMPDVKSRPDEEDALFEKALQAWRSCHWPEAKELLEAVVQHNPEFQKDGQRAAQLLKQIPSQILSEEIACQEAVQPTIPIDQVTQRSEAGGDEVASTAGGQSKSSNQPETLPSDIRSNRSILKWLAGIIILIVVVVIFSVLGSQPPVSPTPRIPPTKAPEPTTAPTRIPNMPVNPTRPPTSLPTIQAPTLTILPTVSATSLPAFINLPEPVNGFKVSNGQWQAFSSSNGANAMVMHDGVMWTINGSGGVVAWDPGTGMQKQYTVYDGLTSNGINSLVVTRQNELWAGTYESGISRFDGLHWKPVDSQGFNEVLAVTIDGAIWASGDYGWKLGRFINGAWKSFTTSNGLPPTLYRVKALAAPDGSLWATFSLRSESNQFSSQISRYKDGAWMTFSGTDGFPKGSIVAITADNKLWMQVENGNLCLFSEKSCGPLIPLNLADQDYIKTSVIAPDGSLVYLTYNYDQRKNTSLMHISEGKSTSYPIKGDISIDNMSKLYFDPQGTFWIGTSDELIKPSVAGQRYYKVSETVGHGDVNGIDIAKDGSLWLTTHGGGVSHFDGKTWKNYRIKDGLADDFLLCNTIAPDRSIWVGTWISGKVGKFDGKTWSSFGFADGINAGGYIWAIASAPDGSIWAGTDNGLATFNGQKWVTTFPAMDSSINNIRSVAAAPNGDIWIGSYDGKVALLSGNNWKIYSDADGLTKDNAVFALAIAPDGTVFAGTSNGLFKFTKNRWEIVPGYAGYINDIAFSKDGSLWVATEFDGIKRYDGTGWREQYKLGSGMLSLRVDAIAIFQDGSIWVGGDGGLARFIPNNK